MQSIEKVNKKKKILNYERAPGTCDTKELLAHIFQTQTQNIFFSKKLANCNIHISKRKVFKFKLFANLDLPATTIYGRSKLKYIR